METTDTTSRRAPGAILRDLRKVLAPEGDRTLTQAKLADRLGYDDDYVQAIETGRKPMQRRFVDEIAQLEDEARFPEAFARLIEELRSAVVAYWDAKDATPPAINDVPPIAGTDGNVATPGGALSDALEGKLTVLAETSEAKLDTVQATLDASAAGNAQAFSELGGKLDRLALDYGAKLDGLCGRQEASAARVEGKLDGLAGKVEATSGRTEGQLDAVSAKVDRADAKAEMKLNGLVAGQSQIHSRIDAATWEVLRTVRRTGGLVLGGVGLATLALGYWLHVRLPASAPARGAGREVARQEAPVVDWNAADEGAPDDESMGSALDGGTELSRLVKQATPMPQRALQGQRAAPCPEGIDEFNGYCWTKASFTAAQVKAGACEDKGMYEPSPGWCREHHAAYRPYRAARQNNSVEPE